MSSLGDCPVCSVLPLEKLRLGEKERPNSLEYFIDSENLDRAELQNWINQAKGNGWDCGLCRLVLELHSFWCGRADYMWARRCSEQFSSTCSRNLWAASRYPGPTFKICSELDSSATDRLQHSVVHANPLEDKTIRFLAEWINYCTLHHDGCRKTLCSFPTRTLDVQDPHCIKLCNTEGQYGQYVALSHCWGGSNTFLTTPTTISAMCDGFSIDQLPLTFRDAVLVTRAFNQRYLWIDSLCIVQGDPQDWANESSKMADVFTNAYFTIGATNSECDTRGFLARPWRYILLNIVSSTSESAQVYLEADPLEAERFEPLYCRAWTLQEQYLSRRILHFCKHQVKVECCTGTLYETIPGFLFADKDTRCVVEDLRPILHNGLLSYAPWYRMISAFSNRSLTYDTDKLPALAGIASRVAEMANGKYCAGIWWDDLPQGLLWFRNSILKKPSKFLAPSWSWASANGSVIFEKILDDEDGFVKKLPYVSFNMMELKATTTSLYGEIKEGAYLEIVAPLIPVNMSPQRPRANVGVTVIIGTPFDFPHRDRDEISPHGGVIFDEVSSDVQGDLFAVVLAWRRGFSRFEREINIDKPGQELESPERPMLSIFHGIMVRRSNQSLDSYERVGYFRTRELFLIGAPTISEEQLIAKIKLF